MAIITITSDFGVSSDYISSIKGIILSKNENIKIIDISHNINLFDKLETAYILKNSYKKFPKNTIHIICVDSSYHKTNSPILSYFNDQYFLCADNGILSLILEDNFQDNTYKINFKENIYSVIEDVFLKTAFEILDGKKIEHIGKKNLNLNIANMPKPYLKDNHIFGEIIYIDNYGNCISNIDKIFFDENKKSEKFDIKLKRQYNKISNIHYTSYNNVRDYYSVYEGKFFSLFNKNKLLEIGIYNAKSNDLLGIKIRDEIEIIF